MIPADQITQLSGRTLYAADGGKIGRIDTLYVDRADAQQPTFVTVHTGLFGTSTSFVPVADATVDGDRVVVPYTKDQVSDAPRIDTDSDLEPAEEARLYHHYGLAPAAGTAAVDTGAGHDTSGPNTDDAMTRSEEKLHVGKEQVETGRARLRKYVVTEQVQTTVPVSHEEVRNEREPITDANVDKALDGPAISEEEHEVVLKAERPVVAKETVPVERVRLGTETVTEQANVSEEVRKEQIEADGVYPDSRTEARENADR